MAVSDDDLRLQLTSALETVRFQMGLLVQLWGFLVAADAALLAFALQVESVPGLLIAATMPALLLAVRYEVLSHVVPVAFVAYQAERALVGGDGGLAAAYLAVRFPGVLRIFAVTEGLNRGEALGVLAEHRGRRHLMTGTVDRKSVV